jgi:hypothetical protein
MATVGRKHLVTGTVLRPRGSRSLLRQFLDSSKLKQNFPAIQVALFDATKQTYVPLELQDKN